MRCKKGSHIHGTKFRGLSPAGALGFASRIKDLPDQLVNEFAHFLAILPRTSHKSRLNEFPQFVGCISDGRNAADLEIQSMEERVLTLFHHEICRKL